MTIRFNTSAQVAIGIGDNPTPEEELAQMQADGLELGPATIEDVEGGQFTLDQDGNLEGARNRRISIGLGESQAQLNLNSLGQQLAHHERSLAELEASKLDEGVKIGERQKLERRIQITKDQIEYEVFRAKETGQRRYRDEGTMSEEGIAGMLAESEAQDATLPRSVDVTRHPDGSVSVQAGHLTKEQEALRYLRGKQSTE